MSSGTLSTTDTIDKTPSEPDAVSGVGGWLGILFVNVFALVILSAFLTPHWLGLFSLESYWRTGGRTASLSSPSAAAFADVGSIGLLLVSMIAWWLGSADRPLAARDDGLRR